MRKLPAILAVAFAMLSTQAVAHPYLSLPAAKRAIKRAEPYGILGGRCYRTAPIQVVCHASENVESGSLKGWVSHYLSTATLTKSGRISVFNNISGPNYRRGCECWVKRRPRPTVSGS